MSLPSLQKAGIGRKWPAISALLVALTPACVNAAHAETGNLPPDQQSAPPQYLRLAQSSAAEFDVADIVAESGQSVPMQISIPSNAASGPGLIMVRGVPPELELSNGFRVGNTWMVSVSELENLALILPDGFENSFNLEIIYVSNNGEDRQSRVASVRIGPVETAQQSQPDRTPTNAIASLPPEERKSDRLSITQEAEAAMLEKAVQLLQGGDVASARLLYEHLANSGSALGALSLAKTYDPDVFFGLDVVGMKPNYELARRWYERAAELGDDAAKQRLKTLASSNRQ